MNGLLIKTLSNFLEAITLLTAKLKEIDERLAKVEKHYS